MYEIFAKLLRERGLKASDVCKATGLRQSMISDWKSGRSTPKADKLQLIADYFGVPLEAFTGKKRESITPAKAQVEFESQLSAIVQAQVQSAYYDGYEAGKKAQDVFADPNLRILMDAASGLDESAILALAEIARRMRGTNPDG